VNANELFISVKYKVGYDTYSDYQITDALNYVLNEINIALNSVSSSLITASTTLSLVDSEAELPADLESIISVTDKICIPFNSELDGYSYQIIGNTIKAQGDTVTIYYKKSNPQYVFDMTITPSTIDLPVSFDNMIRDNVIAFLTGQPTNIQLQTIKLIANRDGRKRPQRLIFNL
jgi:hypothetical protein